MREVADAPDGLCRLTLQQRADLRRVADTLCRLDKLRNDLEMSDPEDDTESERLGVETAAILGLSRS